MRIEPLMLVIFYAISGVVGPFLGQNMAPELQHRQQELRRVILKFCLWLGLCLAVFLYVFAAPIIAWFSDSPVVMQVALSYLLIVPISYGIYGVVMSVNAGFNGLGMPMPSMVISTSRVLLVYFPMALMMQSFWGIKGLFIATALSNVVVGVWGYWWFKRALNASHKHHRSVQD
jgi:Na+-driven multidrug efflux pump